MPSLTLQVPLKTRFAQYSSTASSSSPIPPLLQTPSGLAILEVQGTIHFPAPTSDDRDDSTSTVNTVQTPIGRLVFPLYSPDSLDKESTAWMKRVYLYVGKHQRLTGEVKKLSKPLGVIRQCEQKVKENGDGDGLGLRSQGQNREELEIVEVIKYKILFASRPEPVGE